MPITINEFGYLETPYLSEFPYLQPAREDALGIQFNAVSFVENLKAIQTKSEIIFDGKIGLQWQGFIQNKVKNLAQQHEQKIEAMDLVAWQTNVLNTQNETLATQWVNKFYTDKNFAIQFFAELSTPKDVSVQFEGLNSNGLVTRGLEFRASKVLPHLIAGNYLQDEPYLSEYQYLAPVYHVPMGVQFSNLLTKDKKTGIQLQQQITTQKTKAIQFQGKIIKDGPRGLQFNSVYEKIVALQFRAVLYNTTNLRVLMDFPSRGTTGQNWTSTNTAPSSSNSFSPYNLNTDIVEQYFRTEFGVNSVTLTCDTELAQGVYNDTVGILNHNLSGSASIQMEASNDNFNTIPFVTSIRVEPINSYYIAPTLPLTSYRYWRFIISDPGSVDNFIRVGTIVFGSAIIFTNESFVDRVRYGKQQFVDKVYTEGFTNVSNDRGKKAFLELEFRNITYGRKNYNNLTEIFSYAGIVLKSLWIPVPLQASRFALFGKLDQLPQEEHNYKGADSDFVDYQIRVDESL